MQLQFSVSNPQTRTEEELRIDDEEHFQQDSHVQNGRPLYQLL